MPWPVHDVLLPVEEKRFLLGLYRYLDWQNHRALSGIFSAQGLHLTHFMELHDGCLKCVFSVYAVSSYGSHESVNELIERAVRPYGGVYLEHSFATTREPVRIGFGFEEVFRISTAESTITVKVMPPRSARRSYYSQKMAVGPTTHDLCREVEADIGARQPWVLD
jgi:hypothetical protein